MKKYKILISNSVILFVAMFVLSLIGSTKVFVLSATLSSIIALAIMTASMIALKNFNYKGYTDIPTWKHMRNFIIYATAVGLGGLLGYLL